MTRLYLSAAVALLCLAVAAASASAQTGYRGKNEFRESRFAVEAVDFRTDQEGLYRLEIYYKIFYDGLSYKKTADGYQAEYEVAVVVLGKNGEQIEGFIREGDIKAVTYAETQRSSDFIINLLSVTCEGQDVTVKAVLTDKTSGDVSETKKELKKRDYWGKYPSLSRVEFSSEISSADKESKFNKADLRVIPSVTRQFGGDFDTLLTYYQEIYPGESEVKNIRTISRIYHRVKGCVHADTVEYGDTISLKREVRTIDVAGLLPGDYQLDIRLEGRRGKVYDKTVEDFELMLTAETMFRNDYETAVEMVKYLATKDELKKLKAAVTPQERRELWEQFWKLREDYRHDQENPTRDEYFRRVQHANRHFSIMKKEGWKTTRGMIYITYGEPDEVDDYPFELASKPYQVWLYYRLNPARRFMFIDEWGDGNYELQPPYNGIDW